MSFLLCFVCIIIWGNSNQYEYKLISILDNFQSDNFYRSNYWQNEKKTAIWKIYEERERARERDVNVCKIAKAKSNTVMDTKKKRRQLWNNRATKPPRTQKMKKGKNTATRIPRPKHFIIPTWHGIFSHFVSFQNEIRTCVIFVFFVNAPKRVKLCELRKQMDTQIYKYIMGLLWRLSVKKSKRERERKHDRDRPRKLFISFVPCSR